MMRTLWYTADKWDRVEQSLVLPFLALQPPKLPLPIIHPPLRDGRGAFEGLDRPTRDAAEVVYAGEVRHLYRAATHFAL